MFALAAATTNENSLILTRNREVCLAKLVRSTECYVDVKGEVEKRKKQRGEKFSKIRSIELCCLGFDSIRFDSMMKVR